MRIIFKNFVAVLFFSSTAIAADVSIDNSPAVFDEASRDSSDDPRGAFISKLINSSSGALQVKKSTNLQVRKFYEEAKELLILATDKFSQGQTDEGSSLLDQSAKMMFEAIRLASPSKQGNVKVKHDYNKRMASVKALSDAFNRITDEKNSQDVKLKINKELDEMLNDSRLLKEAGKHKPARVELDKAYVLLKQSIDSLRSGQTLVRSLNFATAEEEYHYELDRNETHIMLISILLDKKKASEYTRKKVAKFKAQSQTLRLEAEAAAAAEKFEQAIELLEQSTKQLVRAIRSAGVYIPG